MKTGEWVVEVGRTHIRIEYSDGKNLIWFVPNHQGKAVRFHYSNYSALRVPPDFFEAYRVIGLSETKVMFPPIRGSYGGATSERRKELCETIALVLNKRGIFPEAKP